MTPSEIVANHIKNNGLQTTPEQSLSEIKATLEQNPDAILVQIKDCLFLLKKEDDGSGLFYIFNGGTGIQYVKAIKEFVNQCRNAGFKVIKMYVSDKEVSQQLAEMVGVLNVSYELDESRKTDPYLMIMEI
jgi:hypothetical protein